MKIGTHLHFGFMVLILLAIFVRGMIPVGFMPSSNAATAITICSGLSTKTIFVKNEKAPQDHDQKEDHVSTCPFAPPVLAESSPLFDVTDFVSVSYAKFHPDNQTRVNLTQIILKSFFSQGPPEISAA